MPAQLTLVPLDDLDADADAAMDAAPPTAKAGGRGGGRGGRRGGAGYRYRGPRRPVLLNRYTRDIGRLGVEQARARLAAAAAGATERPDVDREAA